jgi:hypothetical protein
VSDSSSVTAKSVFRENNEGIQQIATTDGKKRSKHHQNLQ